MLVFSGTTHTRQVQGVIDGRPQQVRIVNDGDGPVVVHEIAIGTDWLTYGLIVPDGAEAIAHGAPAQAPEADETPVFQLWQLALIEHNVILPGEANAWTLLLHWDATHPAAAAGDVTATLTIQPDGGEVETRELTFQAALTQLPVFDGLMAIDWGDANVRGGYVADDAWSHRPVPVLVGGSAGARRGGPSLRATAPDDAEPGTTDPHAARAAANLRRRLGPGARDNAQAAELGTRASLVFDNVQDKFAPVVSVDEQAEIAALRNAPRHLPNLVRNLKQALVNLPPYGGLTRAFLEGRETVVEDQYSINAFRTQLYDLPMLCRLLIETTISTLAREPRRIWDEDEERLLTLPEPVGIVEEAILTYPPLMPGPVRHALRQWFREGGLSLGGSREWDEITARVLHAFFAYVGERGGKVDAFVRRFGKRCDMLVIDVGATGARLARVGLEVALAENPDAANGNGAGTGRRTRPGAGDPPKSESGGYRRAALRVTHFATCLSRTFTGERLTLAVYRILKLKLAALIAPKIGTAATGADADGDSSADDIVSPAARQAARELAEADHHGRVAALLEEPLDDLPDAVEAVFPTQFRDHDEEGPRRRFTLLTMLAARVLHHLSRRGATDWSLTAPDQGPSLQREVAEAVGALYPALPALSDDDWARLRITADEIAAQIEPGLRRLVRTAGKLVTLDLDEQEPLDIDALAQEEARRHGTAQFQRAGWTTGRGATRLGYAKGWGAGDGPSAKRTGASAPPPGSLAAAQAARDAEFRPGPPRILLGGGALLPDVVRRRLVDELTVRDAAGLGAVAPSLWPEPADPATAAALGAVEAERALRSGIHIVVDDSLRRLQFDVGVRSDRFHTLFSRGLSCQATTSVELPFSPTFPLPIWYRHLDAGVEPHLALGTFESDPGGTGPFIVTLAARAAGAWTLELTRGEPYDPDTPTAVPSITLTPAEPLTPLEFSLYSGVH
jgi:hypothetical protein